MFLFSLENGGSTVNVLLRNTGSFSLCIFSVTPRSMKQLPTEKTFISFYRFLHIKKDSKKSTEKTTKTTREMR